MKTEFEEFQSFMEDRLDLLVVQVNSLKLSGYLLALGLLEDSAVWLLEYVHAFGAIGDLRIDDVARGIEWNRKLRERVERAKGVDEAMSAVGGEYESIVSDECAEQLRDGPGLAQISPEAYFRHWQFAMMIYGLRMPRIWQGDSEDIHQVFERQRFPGLCSFFSHAVSWQVLG